MSSLVSSYLQDIAKTYSGGQFTEHSFRGDLQKFLKKLLPDAHITNEPRQITNCGAPDYVLARGKIPFGYIEAKSINKSLDNSAYEEQLSRYFKFTNNLIFTNYLDFRLFRDGKQVSEVSIADFKHNKIKGKPDNFDDFINLIKIFADYEGQTITKAAVLAEHMANRAKALAGVVVKALASDTEDKNKANKRDSELQNQFKTFRRVLMPDMLPTEFADMYAQTIAYGMFAARLHDQTLEDFSRREAAYLIPGSNPFLRKFFQHIAGDDLDKRIQWIVNNLADIFRATDVAELMKNFGKPTHRTDPFIHFYETFLEKYDKKLRKSRGVYYTPEPVVSFIVQAVDEVLKTEFKLSAGLADTAKINVEIEDSQRELHKVQILDPATGTGTFLAEVVKKIHERFVTQKGIWPDYVENDLIPRLNGFEILMASYAMAHLKLEMILKDTGCGPGDSRLRIFLTNSLEEHDSGIGSQLAMWLSDESKEADEIKRDVPVMVVLGNPPYAVSSSNTGDWIRELIESYKIGLKEKKLNLDDDYIKFTCYGEYLIEKTGEGILAYISNNSFIDGITHRQMRRHLLKTFDKIYILDLHGNAKKKETSPDGSPDKNVFDIMQGVSINIFVKTGKKESGALGEVFHFDLFGERKSKYKFLWEHGLGEVKFQKLEPVPPGFFFVPKDFSAQEEYEKGFIVNKLFNVFNSGIKTDRDSLFIDFDAKKLSARIEKLFSGDFDETFKEEFQVKDSGSYKLTRKIQNRNYDANHINSIQYRPFDCRWIYYTPTMISRPAEKAMKHILAGENLGLMTSRSYPTNSVFDRVFITRHIADVHAASDQTYFFPLYTYPDKKQIRLDGESTRKPNLSADIVKNIAGQLDLQFMPEETNRRNTFAPVDMLDYIYAVLHSPAYREKYREFLKIDFPRIPFPENKTQFRKLIKLGAELRALHLMESSKLETLATSYPETGDNIISNIKYEKGKIWINEKQYFEKIPQAAWDFYIGGYQPAQKYLKERKGRALIWDEINHYQKIIVALTETRKIMSRIDKVL
ncbi:MAG: N-6 DNA methylase [Gammaproteobacteria bacterium]|nr:N-6 DNA methylase [Gammaproteobacteria bacterium]